MSETATVPAAVASPVEGRVLRATLSVSAATLLSRLLGYARDAVMAAVFGVGAVHDVFLTAFLVVNLARRFLGEGAFTSAFVPVFSDVRIRRDATGRRLFLSRALGALLVALVSWVACIVTGALLLRLSWGEGATLAAGLTAALAPYALLVCLAAAISAFLNAEGSFFLPALAPAIMNALWIAGAATVLGLGLDPGTGVLVVAAALVASGLLQVAYQIPSAVKRGLPLLPSFRGADPGVQEMRRRIVPLLLAIALQQAHALIDRLLALGLAAPGSVTALYCANRLVQLPTALIGTALATAAFPGLSVLAARGDTRRFAHLVGRGLRFATFAGVAAASFLAVMAYPIVRLLFERGRFDAEAAGATALCLLAYAPSVWAFTLQIPLIRACHARGDLRSPVETGLLASGLNLALSLALVRPFGAPGLALASSVAWVVGLIALQMRVAGTLGEARSEIPLLRPLLLALLPALVMTLGMATASALLQAEGAILGTVVPTAVGALLLVASFRLFAPDDARKIQSLLLRRDD